MHCFAGLHSFLFLLQFQQQAEFKTPVEDMSPQQLNKCFQKFYLSARKRDGNFYNKKSLSAIRAGEISTFNMCICCSIVRKKPSFGSADYSTCVVDTKTIIHLSV